jgi:hypothetical protein
LHWAFGSQYKVAQRYPSFWPKELVKHRDCDLVWWVLFPTNVWFVSPTHLELMEHSIGSHLRRISVWYDWNSMVTRHGRWQISRLLKYITILFQKESNIFI